MGAEYDLKGRAVANYLRINELITPLKRRIDDAEFPIVVAVQLSYLTEQEQQMVDDISNAIILLVRVGAVARFIYCLVRLTAAEEQAAQYKKRARNTVIFYIIAESIWQIKDLILYYYS